LKGDISVVDD
jgi:hypothetical protein